MKQLLNTLYITSPLAYLSLDGENIVINVDKEAIKRVPLHNIESVVTFGRQGASPALMRHTSEMGIGLTFMSATGRFLCRVEGEKNGNVYLRREQYRIADDEERSLKISKNIIGAKTLNSRTVLSRALRDHPFISEPEKISAAVATLKSSMTSIRNAETTDSLRGFEGINASVYYSVFGNLVLQNKDYFKFIRREKHPSTDVCNTLLSFCYTLMTNDCVSALEAVGLDPYVGFMHTDRPGRKSLALDLVEEFRAPFCDRFVLSLINLRKISKEDFIEKENGTILIKDDARKEVLASWQRKKQESIQHPFLKEKCEWGLVPFLQAQLLARYIRGDLIDYPPFLWR